MIIDIKTLILLSVVINMVNFCVMVILWRQYRKYFAGLSSLMAYMIAATTGCFLILLRGLIPDFLSIVLGNTFIIMGALFVLIGFEQFFGIKGRHIYNYILVVGFMCVITYYSLVQPNYMARDISFSATLMLLNLQCFWLLFHRVDLRFRKIARLPEIAFLIYVAVNCGRIILLLIFPIQKSDFFEFAIVDAVSITLYIMLGVFVTMSSILLVSRRLLEEVQTEKDKYNTIFHSSPNAIILTRFSDGEIFEVNDGFTRITGHLASDVIGKKTTDINLWCNEEGRLRILNEISRGNEVREFETQFQDKLGNTLTGLLSSKILMINQEKSILTSVSDITEMSLMKRKLQDMALHDSLTGLANRTLFFDRFEIAKANAQRANNKLAVISLDADLLKSINDHWGHDAGDKVLIAISNRLSNLLRKGDTIARFGGDEFMVLLTELSNKDCVAEVAAKMNELISQPINIGEGIVKVTVSIGIALFPEDGTDLIDILMKKSDKAMYQVKENGRGNFQFYSDLKSIS